MVPEGAGEHPFPLGTAPGISGGGGRGGGEGEKLYSIMALIFTFGQ